MQSKLKPFYESLDGKQKKGKQTTLEKKHEISFYRRKKLKNLENHRKLGKPKIGQKLK